LVVELPVLVAVGTEPVAGVVVPLVGEAHRDAVLAESPDFLDQAIIELLAPFPDQKLHDFVAAAQEFRPVAPDAGGAVGGGDPLRVARVPGVFGSTDLLRGGLGVERRKRGTRRFFVAHRRRSGNVRFRDHNTGRRAPAAGRPLVTARRKRSPITRWRRGPRRRARAGTP